MGGGIDTTWKVEGEYGTIVGSNCHLPISLRFRWLGRQRSESEFWCGIRGYLEIDVYLGVRRGVFKVKTPRTVVGTGLEALFHGGGTLKIGQSFPQNTRIWDLMDLWCVPNRIPCTMSPVKGKPPYPFTYESRRVRGCWDSRTCMVTGFLGLIIPIMYLLTENPRSAVYIFGGFFEDPVLIGVLGFGI